MDDAGTNDPDAGDGAASGPVAVGSYTYAAVAASGLINPPAVAWHPSGAYALVLNYRDKVHLYDSTTHALSEVGSAGTTVSWRAVAFAPDGLKAVLLANVASPTEGRIYLWDAATKALTQMTTETFAAGTYEAITWSPDGTKAKLLASKPNSGTYIPYLWDFDVAAGRSNLKAHTTSAGCQDLAWATDALGASGIAVACGLNGVTLFQLDSTEAFVDYQGNAGNTSRIASRPQGDYALAIGWSSQRVYSFRQGVWSTAFSSPTFPGIFQVGFATSGQRALILGGYGGAAPGVGQVYEFRHDLLSQSAITDVSIASFSQPPYNAGSQVELNDVAWRPNCDEGLIVGGVNSVTAQQGLVIRFSVSNGTSCSN